ncbi:hypothetical protein ABZ490_02880 [Streptomyces sp. NPDC005811]|uniref:hypothetical protein n=1 Tax=Streptomyces sp. NPDC005811 TaxID=3154565 RepID=UPI0033FE5564
MAAPGVRPRSGEPGVAVVAVGGSPYAPGCGCPGSPGGTRSRSARAAAGRPAAPLDAARAPHDDPRLTAAADLDGGLAHVQENATPGHLSTVAADGLDRPFPLVGKDGNGLATVPSWRARWRHSRGPRRGLTLRGAAHATYTKAEPLAHRLRLPRETVKEHIGTLAPHRATTARSTASRRATRSRGPSPEPGGPGRCQWSGGRCRS